MREIDPERHRADAIKNFRAQDKLKPAIRALIYEYGFETVRGLYNDGHRDAEKMREELEAYRGKRQDEWLSQIPFPRTKR